MLQRVTLTDGSAELLIRPRSDVALQELDVAFPEVREVTEPRTDTDGERDTTARHGASTASLTLRVTQQTRAFLDELARFCRPATRPYLVVEDDEWAAPRRLRLRAEQLTRPIATGRGLTREIQAQWKVPDGVWESIDDTIRWINASATSTTGLAVTPVGVEVTSVGVVMPASSDTGAALVTLTGSADVHWIARLYGPATAPRLTLESTGETLQFTSELVIPAGEYVELDSRARSANHVGNTNVSRLQYLDFVASTWWQLRGGMENRIRYHPESGVDARTKAELIWREAWI